MKVIYLGHHALGDAVMKTPAIRYLVNKFDQKNVYFTVRDEIIKNFLIRHTSLNKDNLIIYNKKLSFKLKLNFIRKLRRHKFKYFILPPTIDNKLGKLLFKLSNAKSLIAPYQIYSKPKRNEVYIHKFKHKVLQNLEFVRFFENWSDNKFFQFAEKNYFLDELNNNNIKDIDLNEKFLLIHTGSGGDFYKRYPVEKWKDLVLLLRKKYPNYILYLSGTGTEENKIANTVLEPFKNDNFVKNIVDKYTLDEFMTILRNCNLFISADCGPCHLASIMKKKMVSIFGPTDFNITGPFSHSTCVSANPELISMPDYLRKKYADEGFKLQDCFQSISNFQVLDAIEKNLK